MKSASAGWSRCGLAKENLGAPEKHARVPSISAALEVGLGGRQIGFLDEPKDVHRRTNLLLAEMEVSEAGGRVGRRNRENDHRLVRRRNIGRLTQLAAKGGEISESSSPPEEERKSPRDHANAPRRPQAHRQARYRAWPARKGYCPPAGKGSSARTASNWEAFVRTKTRSHGIEPLDTARRLFREASVH